MSYSDSGGRGAPVVVLHGLAGSRAEFTATAEALPEYRIVLMDLRGHGDSTRNPHDLSRSAFTADVVRLIETAVGGPVTLVGQSMGGHTAMLVAAARPDLVSKLVLLEATVGGDGDRAGREAMRDYFASWPVPFRDAQTAAGFLGDEPLQQAWVANLEHRADGLWPKFDPDVLVATMEAVDQRPRWAEWEHITAPTLAIFAENGIFDERAKRRFVARGKNVHRVDLPAAGHNAHLDTPKTWVAALREFLP